MRSKEKKFERKYMNMACHHAVKFTLKAESAFTQVSLEGDWAIFRRKTITISDVNSTLEWEN